MGDMMNIGVPGMIIHGQHFEEVPCDSLFFQCWLDFALQLKPSLHMHSQAN